MKRVGIAYISKWLWIYLFFVLAISILSNMLMYHAATRLSADVSHIARQQTDGGAVPTENLPDDRLHHHLRSIMLWGIVTVLLVGLVLVRFTIHRLNRPMRAIRKALDRMAEGYLDETIRLDTPDEIGRIGAGINDLAANLQELQLYIWKQTGHCLDLVEQIRQDCPSAQSNQAPPAHIKRIAQLSVALNDLKQMVKAYTYYDVHLDGEQPHAINEPGTAQEMDRR